MEEEKTLTKPNKQPLRPEGPCGKTGTMGEKPRSSAADVPRLVEEAEVLDPLGVMPEVGHLLPAEHSSAVKSVDLTAEAKKPECGAVPLKNRKREEFCRVLTGWGGDGTRKRNCEAYEKVYGKKGATARSQSSWLLAIPEVKKRVAYLERKVEEVKRHDYLAAQQEIDELRLGLVARGKRNAKLAAVALAAARDFEAAHGLGVAKGGGVETATVAAIEAGDGLSAVRAILAKVTRKEGV